MKSRIDTSILRTIALSNNLSMIYATGAKRRGTVYHPKVGTIVGFNFGTSIRPDVSVITVNAQANETVASYLARGGQIHLGTPKTATGAQMVSVIKSGTTRVKTSRG